LAKNIEKTNNLNDKNELDFENFRNAKYMTPNACVAYVTMKSMNGRENLLKMFKAS